MSVDEKQIESRADNSGADYQPYQSTLAQGKYPVDAEEYQTEVLEKDGDRRLIFVYSFATIEREHLLEYGKLVVNKVEVKKGVETPNYNEEDANARLFDLITRGGFCYPEGMSEEQATEKKKLVKFTREQALRFQAEKKSRAIVQHTRCEVKVRPMSDTGIEFMFEGEGEMIVDLFIPDATKPLHVIPVTLLTPKKAKRTAFKDGFVKETRERKMTKVIRTIVTDYATALDFFGDHFLRAENVLIDGGEYEPEKQEAFLEHFSAHFQAEIAGEVVLSFARGAED
ncbi:MAG TPA: hypothetical protein VF708_20000 [Pyrinomonadaceae bacterium]|jgi:hypothetical protein